jgi:hypothetical protein
MLVGLVKALCTLAISTGVTVKDDKKASYLENFSSLENRLLV